MKMMSQQIESINKNIQITKKEPNKILEFKSIISKIKTLLKLEIWAIRRKNQWIEGKSIETNQFKEQKERRMQKKKQNLRDLWNIINHADIYLEGVTKEEEKGKGAERISEEIKSESESHSVMSDTLWPHGL